MSPRTERSRRKAGARSYHDFSEEKVEDALSWKRKHNRSLRETEKKFNIPRMTLNRRMKNNKTNPYGRPKVLSDVDRQFLSEGLAMCADWGFPFNRKDIRYLVKWRLDSMGIIESRFEDNLPSYQWAKTFINASPDISERFAQNVKRTRAGVNSETINEYFNNLEKTLDGISADCIINYDETCFVDDVSREKIICRRGTKHPERIIDTSKTSISVMFGCAPSGKILPPYICYKSENLYDSWKQGGPSGSQYNRSKSGWFNGSVFQDWFNTMILPYFQNKCDSKAKKVLIGDNLASHVSSDMLASCHENNIRFVLLPPNATHLCQPLDVAVFRSVKEAWRRELKKWKSGYVGPLRKDHFLSFLKKTLSSMDTMPENIRSGFEATGIYPINRAKVLSKLKNRENLGSSTSTFNDSAIHWSNEFINLLEGQRAAATQIKTQKKKVDAAPGKSLAEDSESEDEAAVDNPDDNMSTDLKTLDNVDVNPISDMNPNANEIRADLETLQASPGTSDGHVLPMVEDTNEISVEKGEFSIVSLVYNFGTKKETSKNFVCRVLQRNVGRKKKSN